MKPLLRSLALAALLAAPATAEAKVAAGSKTVSFESRSATLSWSKGDFTTAEKPHLTIKIEGQVVLDKDLTKACELCTSLGDPKHDIAFRDVEGDGEPEVTVDLFSGGAHCCFTTLIFRLKPGPPPTYSTTVASWGNGGYVLKQLDGDGIADFVTTDDAFAYTFAPYVASYRPPQFFEFRAGRMVNRTRHFPALIRKDLHEIDKELPDARKFGETRGLIAARVADMYLLGLGPKVNAYLEAALKRGDLNGMSGYPKGRKFITALKKFLRKTGYIT